MKSLKDLQKIKDEVIKETNLRHYKEGYKVIVAMGEVGLELGARKVLNALAQETYDNNCSFSNYYCSSCSRYFNERQFHSTGR